MVQAAKYVGATENYAKKIYNEIEKTVPYGKVQGVYAICKSHSFLCFRKQFTKFALDFKTIWPKIDFSAIEPAEVSASHIASREPNIGLRLLYMVFLPYPILRT